MATQTMWTCKDTLQSSNESRYSVEEACAKTCWEIVQEVDAFSFNVCCDCLVYIAGQEDPSLSQREIQDIMTFKGIDVLSGNHCQQFTNAMGR